MDIHRKDITNAGKSFIRKPERKKSFGILRLRWEVNIQMSYGLVDWIELTYVGVHFGVSVKAVRIKVS